jgi:hypothetical protein
MPTTEEGNFTVHARDGGVFYLLVGVFPFITLIVSGLKQMQHNEAVRTERNLVKFHIRVRRVVLSSWLSASSVSNGDLACQSVKTLDIVVGLREICR